MATHNSLLLGPFSRSQLALDHFEHELGKARGKRDLSTSKLRSLEVADKYRPEINKNNVFHSETRQGAGRLSERELARPGRFANLLGHQLDLCHP